jgi:hypothetical protein
VIIGRWGWRFRARTDQRSGPNRPPLPPPANCQPLPLPLAHACPRPAFKADASPLLCSRSKAAHVRGWSARCQRRQPRHGLLEVDDLESQDCRWIRVETELVSPVNPAASPEQQGDRSNLLGVSRRGPADGGAEAIGPPSCPLASDGDRQDTIHHPNVINLVISGVGLWLSRVCARYAAA